MNFLKLKLFLGILKFEYFVVFVDSNLEFISSNLIAINIKGFEIMSIVFSSLNFDLPN